LIIVRNVRELFSFNRGVSYFYEARCIDEVNRGFVSGPEILTPDGGIHLLQVKHWFCFIGRCPHIAPPHPRMVVEIVVDLPAFFVASISLLATTIS
jgi:hypothetical protein